MLLLLVVSAPGHHCCSFVNDVAWCARWCTVALFFETQQGLVLLWIDSRRTSMKIHLNRCTSYTQSSGSTLYHRATENAMGDLFNGWTNGIILESVSSIKSSVVYVARRLLTASPYEVTVPFFWRLCSFGSSAMQALSVAAGSCFKKSGAAEGQLLVR